MELFPKYIPSEEEILQDKKDRTRHIGTDLLLLAIALGISFVSTLAGDYNEDIYIHYPQLRPLNMTFAWIGLVWVVAVVLFRFLMKNGTKKKLICMYVLDAALMVFLTLRLILSHMVAYPDLEPSIWGILNIVVNSLVLLYLPVFHLIYYRKSKITLVD